MPLLEDLTRRSVQSLMRALPLPISLPVDLERTRAAIGAAELRGRTVFTTRLRGDLDERIAQELLVRGANVVALDPDAGADRIDRLCRPNAAGGKLHRAPLAEKTTDALLRQVKDLSPSGEEKARAKPAVLLHRLELPAKGATAEATLAILKQLYAIGHTAANALPKRSRVVIVVDGLEGADPIHGRVVSRAVMPFVRSLTKELGKKASTVHALFPSGHAHAETAKAIAYLVGPRASFLTGLGLAVSAPKVGADAAPGSRVRALQGKVAVVTGAGRGIGAAIAERLAREGATIGLNDLPSAERAAAKVLARIRKAGGEAFFLPFDVASLEGAAALAAAVKAQCGHVDILVNNAGITRDKTIKRMKPEVWDLGVGVNLGSQLLVSEALVPIMREGGRIVNLSSVMGIAGNFGQTNYATAKGGVLGLTEALGETLGAAKGIQVNAMAPGFIETRLTKQMPLLNREMAKQLTALLQPGLPGDVADLALFLAGPDGAGLNGSTIRVDGGMAVGA